MEDEKTEGLLLQAIPYLGRKKILKILTPQNGLITLITQKKTLQSFTDPFLVAEWIYLRGTKEIHKLMDASLIEDLAGLRNSFGAIEAAGKIGQVILSVTLAEKRSLSLYTLALAYFRKIASFSSYHGLVASFQLKLLLLEGILAIQPVCSACDRAATILNDGESFCKEHARDRRIEFSLEEWDLLHKLTFTRQFQELRELVVDQGMGERISSIFSEINAK